MAKTLQGAQILGQLPSTPTRLTLCQYKNTNNYYTVNNGPVHHVTSNTNNTLSQKQEHHHRTSNMVDNKSAIQNNNNTRNINKNTSKSISNTSTSTSANTTFTTTTNTDNNTTTNKLPTPTATGSLARRTFRIIIYATWRTLTAHLSLLFRIIRIPMWLVPGLSGLLAALFFILFLITALVVFWLSLQLSSSTVISTTLWLFQYVLRKWKSWLGGCIGYLWRSLFGDAPSPSPSIPQPSSTSTTTPSTASATASAGLWAWAWVPFSHAFQNPLSTTTVSSSDSSTTVAAKLFTTPPNDQSKVSEEEIENFLWDTWYIRKGTVQLAAQPVLDNTLQQALNRLNKLKTSVQVMLRSDANKDVSDTILPALDRISAPFSLAQAAVGPAIGRHRHIEDDLIAMVAADHAAALHLNRRILYRNASAEAARRQRLLTPSSSYPFLDWLTRMAERIRYAVFHMLSHAGFVTPPVPSLPTLPPVTPLSIVVDRLNQWEVVVQIAEDKRELFLRGNSGVLNEFRLNDQVGSATCEAYHEIHQSLVDCGDISSDIHHAQAQHEEKGEGAEEVKKQPQQQQKQKQSAKEVLRREDSLITAMSPEQQSWLETLDALGQFTCAWGDEFLEWQRDKGVRVQTELDVLRSTNEQRQGLMMSLKAGWEEGQEGGGDAGEQGDKTVGLVEAILMRATRAWLDLLHRHWEDLDDIQ